MALDKATVLADTYADGLLMRTRSTREMRKRLWSSAILLGVAAVAAPPFAWAQVAETGSYTVSYQSALGKEPAGGPLTFVWRGPNGRFAEPPYLPGLSRNHPPAAARRWKINTHLFAANIALKDAVSDGMVTIPPFGEFPVAAAALSALKAYPATYRAGVLGPDLFPEMYTGGWAIHSDMLETEKWLADNWMRHVWSRAREWPKQDERDRVMAFAYGFLTHAAGDMFAHTYVSRKADGAWVSGPDFPRPHSTAIKHIVLEGYIGARTPPTDETMDVWPRFVAEVLIKDPAVRQHTRNLKHYQTWLAIYDWLGPQIQKARQQMNNNIRNDAPYWMKCSVNPVSCAKKEQMESWQLDIDRGLRALVDSSQTLGEKMMDGKTTEGI
ncbi:MAG: zinc dependent phospholipase C family protein, partial [Gemmatimonadaceae bacterium]